MRAAVLVLLILGLAACSEKDRLMGKPWACQPSKEMKVTMSFLKETKLEAQLEMTEPEEPPRPGVERQPLLVKMALTGQWVQPAPGFMDFVFRTASVTEAKRGDTPMSEADVFFYKDMFESSPKTSTEIVELSGGKFRYKERSSDKVVTCTR